MRASIRVFAAVTIGLAVSGCDYFFPKYAAEVGVAEGTETRWEIWGDFGSLDECRSAATARYNQYYSQGRARSWSCLEKNSSGGYASRHR